MYNLEDMRKKCKCGNKLYGYADDVHEFWICYKCGRFVGKTRDTIFARMIKTEPSMVIDLIHDGTLRPIERN